MLTIERIRHELQDLRLGRVSEATGIHYNTLRDLRDTPGANPKARTVEALSLYIEQRGRMADGD